MRELTVDAAARDAGECPEARADVLRPDGVAVDASAVGRQLEEAPHDPLVPLLLLPGRGRHHSRSQSSTAIELGTRRVGVEGSRRLGLIRSAEERSFARRFGLGERRGPGGCAWAGLCV